MAFEWWDMWTKGIRVKSLRVLVLLVAKYCYGHEGVAFIDFYDRFAHQGEKLIKMKDVVDLFMEKEGMTQRVAYDYANAIKTIQFLTR